jgi:uncharacterized protein (TIGR00369 family)
MTDSNELLTEQGRAALQAQPFSVMLGAHLQRLGPGEAELRLVLRPELLQQNGFAHGGVLCYLADNALTFAGGSLLGASVVTAEFKINFLRPAVGDELVARATTLHAGRNLAVCRCDIFVQVGHGSPQLCATAQGTISYRASSAASADPVRSSHAS